MNRDHRITRIAFFLLLTSPLMTHSARAEEGMWTFDNPPIKQLKERYNFTPTQEWLDHVRLSSVRLNDGGSGSFVSDTGLLLTNHHVARGQLQKNSTAEHDYIKDGFYAATPEQEMKSPDLEVNVLVSMENVTDRVQAAIKGKGEKEALKARKAVTADIERESLQKTSLRSDVVPLYQGGEYWLYRYKKYTDVRLVFAPEQQIAFFGGDSDNFTYPRHDLDMAIFRVYEDGKPIQSTNHLKWNARGAGDNELVFVSGHPGTTQRQDTMAQVFYERDTWLPLILDMLKTRIAILKAYSAKGPEQARQSASLIFGLENSLKAENGIYEGLHDKSLIASKQKDEDAFRALVNGKPEWRSEFGGAWDAIGSAEEKSATRAKQQMFRRTESQLANMALQIVQYVAEVKKPDGERLRGFHESQLESLKFRLLYPAPIYPGFESARMAGFLEKSVKELGAQDPYVKEVLGGRTPDEAVKELIGGTKLADPAVRKALLDGGPDAVASSADPLIVLARKLDPLNREAIKWREDNVESVEAQAGEKLGKARFAAFGKTTYPDATFTLRLAYGSVKGFPMNGTKAPYKTTFYGLYDRAASFDFAGDYYLPSRYMENREKLSLATPLNFVNTCDIIGGNSGSPVINKDAEIVGLIFDGNIESLVGDYAYDGTTNRAVAVHTAAMTVALRQIYGAAKLADELQGPMAGMH